MSNSVRYHETWKKHRAKVRELRKTYEDRMKAIEGYEGSAKYAEEKEKAEKAFSDGLEALREKSRKEFGHIFYELGKHVEPEGITPPSQEQLAVLQMLDLREKLDDSDIRAAMKSLQGNDAAVRTLGDIAMRKGSRLPVGYTSNQQQRRHILDELQKASESLMAWDGRPRSKVMGDYLSALHNQRWGNGEHADGAMLNSLHVADIECNCAADTLKAILPECDMGTVSAFMNER